MDYGKLLDEMMGSGLVSACPVEGGTAQNLALAGLCAKKHPCSIVHCDLLVVVMAYEKGG